jgi:hypothetical protein
MIIKCRICGNNFEHPDGKRGKKPDVCKSESCKKAQQKEYNANWKNKDKPGTTDTSKAGWPEDTKRCQRCGKLFISDSKSRICPVCLSAEPLPKQLDESLAKAKEAGFGPEDYGKFKAAKTLAGLEPIDTRLEVKAKETKQAIDDFIEYSPKVIGKVESSKLEERGFTAIIKTVSPAKEVIENMVVSEETINYLKNATNQVRHTMDIESPYSKCETCNPTSNHDFICALEDLMDMADKWHMDPDKVYPLAEDILRKGIMNHTTEAGR